MQFLKKLDFRNSILLFYGWSDWSNQSDCIYEFLYLNKNTNLTIEK